MDDNTLIGAAKQAAGRVERAAGNLVGDPEAEMRGAARELGGAAQRTYGETMDDARDVVSRVAIPPVLAGVVVGLVIGLFLNRR